MAKVKERTWYSVSCSASVWSWASSLGRTVWHCTNKNTFNLFEHCTNQKQVELVQCSINPPADRNSMCNKLVTSEMMIAFQVSHPLQDPWTMSRSLVKINVNQFSPVTDLVPFSFSPPVVFVGSLSCSLLDVPLMQLPHRNQKLSKQVELVLVWRWPPKIEMVCVINRWRVKPRLRQTANANRNCTAWPTFPFYSFRLLFVISTWKLFVSGHVHRSEFFWTVLSVYFLNLENSQPSSHFCRLP